MHREFFSDDRDYKVTNIPKYGPNPVHQNHEKRNMANHHFAQFMEHTKTVEKLKL